MLIMGGKVNVDSAWILKIASGNGCNGYINVPRGTAYHAKYEVEGCP